MNPQDPSVDKIMPPEISQVSPTLGNAYFYANSSFYFPSRPDSRTFPVLELDSRFVTLSTKSGNTAGCAIELRSYRPWAEDSRSTGKAFGRIPPKVVLGQSLQALGAGA